MKTPIAMLALLCALFIGAPLAPAQQPGEVPAASEGSLRVGVVHRPPFAIRTVDGAWLGMSVDLWRITAEDLGLNYRYVELERGEVAEALASGAVDLALPVDATPELEETAELTHPFYTATLGVASERRSRLLEVAARFLSLEFLRLVLGLSALLLAVGALVWLLERRRNDEQFSRAPLKGLGDGFWWAGVTLTTIGYGDKAPVTLAGRAVAMLWMLVGLAVSAALTAAVVTMAGLGHDHVDVPEALRDRQVGAVAGSTAAGFLSREEVAYAEFPTVEAALRALGAGEVELVAAAAPALAHVVAETGGLNAAVQTTRLDPQYVAIALPERSELRKQINAALLRRLTSETGWNLIRRYLPEE